MFSVIIPVHNKLPHLDRSVHSVLNQTFEDFELLLIDDASTDGSEEKIKDYDDPRIRFFHRETPGPGGYAARNLGIKEAKYDWIAFLDADDEWKESYLGIKEEVIKRDKDLEVVSSGYNLYDKKDLGIKKGLRDIQESKLEFSLADYLNQDALIWTGAVIIKKDLLEQAGMFPAGQCKRGGDLDTWIRCLDKSQKNLFINQQISMYYRDSVNQVTNVETNPSKGFCPATFLNQIRNETQDPKLLQAINNFYCKYAYSILSRGKVSREYKTFLLGLITSNTQRLSVITKVRLRYLLSKFGILEFAKSLK